MDNSKVKFVYLTWLSLMVPKAQNKVLFLAVSGHKKIFFEPLRYTTNVDWTRMVLNVNRPLHKSLD